MDDDGGASTTRSSSAAVAEKQIIQQQQQQPSPAEKLLLSFENPNYQLERQFKSMDQARIDDHLNSNIAPANICYAISLIIYDSGLKEVVWNFVYNFSWHVQWSLLCFGSELREGVS